MLDNTHGTYVLLSLFDFPKRKKKEKFQENIYKKIRHLTINAIATIYSKIQHQMLP